MSVPLFDRTDGAMKGWPGGAMYLPGGEVRHAFRPAGPTDKAVAPWAEVTRGPGRWIYCKYCDRSTLPLSVHEHLTGHPETVMTVCSRCGYGLTPPVAIHVE